VLIVPDTAEARALAAICEGSLAKINVTDRYVTEEWRKLGMNVVANGIMALTNHTFEVFARPDIITLAKALLNEVWAVGRAEGADLIVERDATFIDDLGLSRNEGGTSMLYDRRAGRPTEHDALHGAVLRVAARHGIDTPLTQAMAALIAAGDPD
jgi:2-dehydropantoate 2-reductase